MSIAPWIAVLVFSCGCSRPIDLGFNPAFIDEPGTGARELVVFPMRGESFSLPMPPQLGAAAYAPDGRSIYTAPTYPLPIDQGGIFKISLSPVRALRLQGSPNFVNAYSIAVSYDEERVYVAGDYKSADGRQCGLFEFAIQSASIRQILVDPACRYLSSWGYLSVSPDNRRAVAFRKPNLELIDLTTGTITSLGPTFVRAAFSPDGKWLAAIEWLSTDIRSTSTHTILMDAKTLERKKVLESSSANWSPDSKYLSSVGGWYCGPYYGTVQVIDVRTGATTSVASSRCKVNSSTGWVNKSIQP